MTLYIFFFLQRVCHHAGEMITAPIADPKNDEEKATYEKRCAARKDIVTQLGYCLETVLFFYFMLRKFIVITPS